MFRVNQKVFNLSRLYLQQQVRYASQNTIGFVGLGNMGANMSAHLITKGHDLVVYDTQQSAIDEMVKKGAKPASSVADLASKCTHVFTMLPSNPHVLDVYTSENGLIANAKPGTYLMDSSTIDPNVSRQVAKQAKEKNVIFLDTPVSGAVPAARAATLTFMVGGQAQHVENIKDLLLCMGKNVVHCGDIGAGEVAKICNNMMLAISMIGTSEVLNLASNLGLDPKLMTKILNISSGRTWVSEIYNPVPGVMENIPSSNNYENGFFTHLIAKDLKLAQNCANESESPTPMGSLARTIYRTMLNNGLYGKDFSIVYQFLKDKHDHKL